MFPRVLGGQKLTVTLHHDTPVEYSATISWTTSYSTECESNRLSVSVYIIIALYTLSSHRLQSCCIHKVLFWYVIWRIHCVQLPSPQRKLLSISTVLTGTSTVAYTMIQVRNYTFHGLRYRFPSFKFKVS